MIRKNALLRTIGRAIQAGTRPKRLGQEIEADVKRLWDIPRSDPRWLGERERIRMKLADLMDTETELGGKGDAAFYLMRKYPDVLGGL